VKRLPVTPRLRNHRAVALLGTKQRRELDKRIRALREQLDEANRARNEELSDVVLEELETVDPDNPRWPHRRGDVLRRMGRTQDAVHCFIRAVALYANAGFLPRAIAMAKVVLEHDPSRADVLETVDPSAARELNRKLRPEGVHIEDVGAERLSASALELVPDQSAPPSEVRFSAVPPEAPRRSLGIAPSEEELRLSPTEAAGAPVAVEDEPESEAERQACLPLLPLLAEAPPEALQRIAREAELVRVDDGQTVIRRGDPADALFGIVEGGVRVAVPGLGDEEQPRLGAGEIFGEACLLGNEPRRADVRADAALTALRIPKQTLTELVQLHPALGDVLLELLTRRLLGNLLKTSPLFSDLSPAERRAVAGEFELRRAREATELVAVGKRSDALFITLTGQIELTAAGGEPRVEGPGAMFGHASVLEGSPSRLGVRTRDTLLVLRLPRQAFARVAMQYPAMLARLTELDPLAHVSP
jgi:CRP-like cAMP-binding protein